MSSFLPNLWTSIFTSGTTPTLLLATNLTFASLQIVLLLLLLATRSLHFLALSFICGGLWWAINWFAAEVAAVKAQQAKEEEEKRGGGAEEEDEGERTEVEGEAEGRRGSLSLSGFEEGRVEDSSEGNRVRRRNQKNSSSGEKQTDLSGEVSTDSEWEKVDDGR